MKKTIMVFSLITLYSMACEDCYNWKSLKYSKFEINYPSSWTLNEEGDLGTVFIIYSHLEDNMDSFKENINLIKLGFNNEKTNLNQYSQSTVKQIQRLIPDCKVISNSKLESNGKEYQKIIYTGSHGKLNLQHTQCIWVHQSEIYVLTYTCEISKINQYKFKTDKILESFYLKDN